MEEIKMDIVIVIGGALFVLGMLIAAVNTRIDYGFFTHYRSVNRGVNLIAILLIIIGLGIVILKFMANGQ